VLDWKAEISKRLANLNLEPTREAEIIEELSQHLEDSYQELLYAGMPKAEARQLALAELTESDLLERELRRVARAVSQGPEIGASVGGNIIAGLWQDLRYGARVLRKNPGFAVVAVLTLALGIGVNTAIFSLANALLLRPPQGVYKAEDVIQLGRTLNGSDFSTFSYPDYVDCRNQNTSFVELAAYRQTGLYLTTGGTPEQLTGMLVSGNYFKALGTDAEAGRTLTPEDDNGTPGANPVAVISHGLWEGRFGSDPNIVGRVIDLNNFPFTIVGVMQNGFTGIAVGEATDVWLPLTMYSQADPILYEKRLEARHIAWLGVLGRLKTGVALPQAQADMTIIARRLEQTYPNTNRGLGIALASGLGLQPQRRDEARIRMGILLAIGGLILLIVCANVANLMLARGAARRKEITIRLALGAGRVRLIRQLLTEALLISMFGGVLGIILAFASRKLLLASDLLTGVRLSVDDLRFDGRVLGFALLVSLATGLIFGVIPAFEASKLQLQSMLKDRSAAGLPRSRFRGVLVVSQVALSVLVLICAGLFVRTLLNAEATQPGFDVDRILVTPVDVGRRQYSEEQGRLFYQQLVERVSAMPGVSMASLAVTMPLRGSWRTGFHLEGQATTGSDSACDYNMVAPRYFETTGIGLLRGRDFTEHDQPNSPSVVIVNEEFVQRMFPRENPIGKRLAIPWHKGDSTYSEIIGVAKNVKYERLTESPRMYFYVPLLQQYQSFAMLLVRSRGDDPSVLARAVEREARTLDSNSPAYNVTILADQLRDSLAPQRSAAMMLGIFGLLALALASIGLYGVLAYSVVQRQHEIGIRMALGAQAGDVLALVIKQGMLLTGIGLALGLSAAFLCTRLIANQLYGVSPIDPITLGVASSMLGVVALLACYLPARRATKVDPLVALRSE